MCACEGSTRGAERHGADVQRGPGSPETGHVGAEGREEQLEGCAQCRQRARTGSQVQMISISLHLLLF